MKAIFFLYVFLVWYGKRRNSGKGLETLCLMYWGAALMWMVDGFFRLAEGEPFFELSLDDALLGMLVVASGLVVYAVSLALNRRSPSLSA
ncbi:hypothetical protein FACS189475_09270 [Betaproteobacteria bacterium]|nr:hypothetical protein FACS189475_09270 [Betaproteobacteria bacterium]